jgi:hypothetical protein
VDQYTSFAFDHLQRLLRKRCKSVERSCIKYNSVFSSKSGCVGLTSEGSFLGCSHLFLVNTHLDIPGRSPEGTRSSALERSPPKDKGGQVLRPLL